MRLTASILTPGGVHWHHEPADRTPPRRLRRCCARGALRKARTRGRFLRQRPRGRRGADRDAARADRRRPAAAPRRDRLRPGRVSRRALGVLVTGGAALTAWGVFESQWLQARRLSVPVADLPAALDGLSILHLSDFHAGTPSLNQRTLRKAVAFGVQEQPDM